MRMYSNLKDLCGRLNMYQCLEVRFKYSLEILIVFSLPSMASLTLHSTFLPVPYCAQTVAMMC